MQVKKDPLVKYKDMNISGQAVAVISIACFIEIIIELIIQPPAFNWYNYVINALILVLFIVLSPYYEDVFEYHFYWTAGSMVIFNLLFKSFSLYGIIVTWVLNGIFFLILFDIILNTFMGQPNKDISLQSVIKLATLLYIIETLIYLLAHNTLGYPFLAASCSIIMIIFGYAYSKGKLQVVGGIFFLGTVILNFVLQSGINGYFAGSSIYLLFGVLALFTRISNH